MFHELLRARVLPLSAVVRGCSKLPSCSKCPGPKNPVCKQKLREDVCENTAKDALKKKGLCPCKYIEIKPRSSHILCPHHKQPSIVIIGGGIAGLTVAGKLMHYGLTNFVLLEATERLGGRVHSVQVGKDVAELGAQWIEGGSLANPAFVMACQEGVLTKPLMRPTEHCSCCTGDGHAVNQEVYKRAYQAFRTIENDAENMYRFADSTEYKSSNLGDFVKLRIVDIVQEFPKVHRKDAACAMAGLMNELRCYIGEDLSLVNTNMCGSRRKLPGGYVGIPSGLIRIMSSVIRDLPKEKVYLRKPVKLIRWGGLTTGPRAVVRCKDGEEFIADYVVIAIPLGVLKAHATKLFCPSLPCHKMDAIRNIGFGKVDKIFLFYERPFWVRREGCVRLGWSSAELANRTDWVKGICKIDEISKNVLCAWVSGEEAAHMETRREDEVAADCTKLLRQFTGDRTLPFPNTVVRSTWSSNKYFLGAASYMSVNSNIEHYAMLQSPLPEKDACSAPVLLFAGEHTSTSYHGTLHGAVDSGIREATRIAELTRRYQGPPIVQEAPELLSCCAIEKY